MVIFQYREGFCRTRDLGLGVSTDCYLLLFFRTLFFFFSRFELELDPRDFGLDRGSAPWKNESTAECLSFWSTGKARQMVDAKLASRFVEL